MWGRQYYRIKTKIYSLPIVPGNIDDYSILGQFTSLYCLGSIKRNLTKEYAYYIQQTFSIMNDSKVYLKRASFSSLIQYNALSNIITLMKNVSSLQNGYKKIYFITEHIVQEYFSKKFEIAKRVTPFYIPQQKALRWDLIEGMNEVLQLRKTKFYNTTYESKPEVEYENN